MTALAGHDQPREIHLAEMRLAFPIRLLLASASDVAKNCHGSNAARRPAMAYGIAPEGQAGHLRL